MYTIKGYKDEWRIQEYVLITFFISWLSWGILILLTNLKAITFNHPLGMILFGVGGFGPTIAAIMCLEGRLSMKKIQNFIFEHKKKTIWCLLLFAVMLIMTVWLASTGTNADMPWYSLPIIFMVCVFFGGGNEELGWRGTMQPLLEKVMQSRVKNRFWSYILTTLIVGVVWAIWHLPLWFVVGSNQQTMDLGRFVFEVIVMSFWLAFVYGRTRSVFYCMLLHGLANTLMAFFILQTSWVYYLGYAVITAVAIFLSVKKPQGKIYENS